MRGDDRERDGGNGVDHRLTFEGSGSWFLAFLVAGATLVVADRYANYVWELGPAVPVVGTHLGSVLFSVALLGTALAALRLEGVPFSGIGLDPGLLAPAVGMVAGYFLAVNAAGIGIALAVAAPETVGYQWTVPPAEAAFAFAFMVVVAGLVEEVVFRGYLQNRLVAMARGGPRIRVAVGLVLASAFFSAYHVPRVLTDGAPGAMTASSYLLLLLVNGLGFGLLYEFTHNLYVPILVHAAGNMPGTAGILFFRPGGWPSWAIGVYAVAYLGLVVLAVVAYRRWAFEAGTMPVWTDRATGERGSRPES